MNYIDTVIPDVKIIEPKVFGDERGFFMETFRVDEFNKQCCSRVFVQDNHSKSSQGILRGLHYQLPPEPQGKLVRCSLGAIFDVAVDLRAHSPTYGQWVSAELSAANQQQLWVPVGFAHGFLTLSGRAEVQYKASGFWNRACERSVKEALCHGTSLS